MPLRDRNDLETIAAFAEELADLAAPVALRYFRQKLVVESKADTSPVTIADREAELAMRRMIAERFPEHGLFGEEHGLDRADADCVWVLDPIDGTKSFITGMPTFGTLVAYLEGACPERASSIIAPWESAGSGMRGARRSGTASRAAPADGRISPTPSFTPRRPTSSQARTATASRR